MSNGKHNWAILLATFTFPVAAIALVLALRNDPRSSRADKKEAPTRPVASTPMGSSGQPFMVPPPHPHPPPPPGGPGHPGHPGAWRADLAQAIERLAKELKLTDKQLKSVRKQADAANNRLEEVSLAIRRAERKLRRVLEDPATTEAQLLAVVGQLTKLSGERHKLSIVTPWRIRGVLTPAQRKRLSELAAAGSGQRWGPRRWRVRAWRGMGQGMGPGRPPGPPHHFGPGMGPHGPFGPGMGPRGRFGPGMGPHGPFGPGMGPRGPMSMRR